MNYTLTLIFLDGDKVEIVLDKPHRLASSPTPALTYEDAEGNFHNIPLSSLKDFFFHPMNYRLCEDWNSPKLEKPTPNCNCPLCIQRAEQIKKIAST